ncbi:MAG: GMC oxidoreductase [Pseudomonadota bacterium]|nr:GMC oxidoreductase [Pseudomonadota bacterium]
MLISDRHAPLPAADICVVGAGPVGLALAFKLEALGLSVLVLEAGPDEAHDAVATEFSNGHHALPGAASHRGIGGTSALWGGRCVPFDDLDFEQREHVPVPGWPIGHAQIACHYDEAASFLDAGTIAARPPGAAAGPVVTDALEYWSKSPALAPLYEERLRQSRRIFLAPRSSVSELICAPGGDRLTHVRVLRHDRREVIAVSRLVLAAGGLETARLLLGLQQRQPQLFGGVDGALGGYYQGHLTGYLAVIHLADSALVGDLSFQTDAHGYRFRRRFQVAAPVQMQERLLNTVFWLDAISISDPIHGSGSLSLLYLLMTASGTYRWLSRGLAPRPTQRRKGQLRGHLKNIRLRGVSLRRAWRTLGQIWRGVDGGMLANPAGRYLLRYHAEQVPQPGSRVQLTEAADGRPRLTVDYRVGEDDLTSVLRSHVLLDAWLSRHQLGRLDYLHDEAERRQSVRAQAFDGYHQIGLARMGDDSRTSVVDRDCRVHGLANLYLAGASVFSTGGHANPTLPAVALALRLGQHLAKTHRLDHQGRKRPIAGRRDDDERVAPQARHPNAPDPA